MTDDLIAQIQSFTLAARTSLEAEAGQQLEGIYGWLPDGTFGSAKGYPALGRIDEARETRQRLEQFAEDEKVAGLDANSARRKLVRETVFTWLNRLAAFRLMEERRLLKPTIVKLEKSQAFIYWLTDEKTAQGQQAYALHQQGALPLNAMGEGPSDIAYRRFLLWQCGELSRDVSVLFDPGTVASRLCPRPTLLKQLVTDMNAEALADAWKAGNEETIGWIYAAFNAEEKRATFDAFSKGKKITAEQIAPATQVFTPRWVVRYLVENSLGRLWVEMHPTSRLKKSLGYLVPGETALKRPLKLVRDISFLDPATGSMHFGLVAFDIFAEMYREELELAGQPGWLATASVASANEIPASIVANNLHGIDLDLRATQLSSLTLLLRARTLNPKCAFTDENLVCANVEEITGGRLEEFIKQAKFSHPIYERILRALAVQLRTSNHLGSLLRLEKELERLITVERRQAEADQQFALDFPGLKTEAFETQAGLHEFFDILTDQIIRHLDGFVQASRIQGSDPRHFAKEASKGMRFLRLVERRYDIVATNPPYLDSRDYSAIHKTYLEGQFPSSKRNLFAAFIQRCLEFANPQGFVAMITGQSFMFISSYEKLRADLLDGAAIETLAQFDYNLFKERVDTAAFVLRREPDTRRREEQVGVYFRLVKEPDADCKRYAFEAALTASRDQQADSVTFCCLQKDFDAISGKPWVYWISPRIREIFRNYPMLGNIAKPKHGMATANNARFLRQWYEVGKCRIGFGFLEAKHAARCGKKWFPYMKGGPPTKWYGNLNHVVNYGNDGYELKAWTDPLYDNSGWSRSLVSAGFYFRKGITWSLTSSRGFGARLSPGGFVFDANGMTIFPPEAVMLDVIGLLNSRIAKFFLSAISPTIAFQVCDIERIPAPNQQNARIEELTRQCIELARSESKESEITYDFIMPPRRLENGVARKEQLAALEAEINAKVSRLYGLNEDDLAAIDRELSDAVPVTTAEVDSGEAAYGGDDDDSDLDFAPDDLAKSWITYAFGMVLGRFQIGVPDCLGCGDFPDNLVVEIRELVDADGIMASDKDHPQDIVKRTLECLVLMLGRDATHATIHAATESDGDPEELLRDWIDRQFWKYHLQLYRKRPIYWPLQSPKKKFTVWMFHEKFSKDTLFRVKDQFVQVKINWLNGRIKDLKPKTLSSDTRRAAEKEISQLSDVLDDVQEFAERIKRITERGYTPHIDDGVLLNAAPLWELLPAWKDAEKAWTELAAGDYDWAQQAMEYWPDRVKQACKTNKSFAIAHGLA